MLGHELRNPLSPILTALQLMRLKNQASREQDIIERQVQSLMRLVDDLLDISRITQGKVELRKERIELAEIAGRAVELSSPVLEGKRQILQVAIPARGLVVDADPSRLAQVLANLLTNAAKYSDPDTRVVFAAELVRRPRADQRQGPGDRDVAGTAGRACSTCSSRTARASTARRAAWGSASRSCAAWWRCTAAR